MLNKTYRKKGGSKCITDEPKTMVNAANNTAPEVIPIKSGDANGFLNKPCKLVPQIDNAAPVKIAIKIRGIRNSIKTKESAV